ncbi:MAG: cyclase family protein [Streptomycetales bacterium]
MAALPGLLAGITEGSIEVVDLTATLSESTPIIRLPEPFANTPGFSLEELSRYDDRGVAWYWNAIHTGEHVGTHLDAPVHWVTGRDGLDVSQIPARQLIGPAVVVDKSAECRADSDFLLEIADVEAWVGDHGPLPTGGWLLYRTGWDARAHEQESFLNADETGPHTPGISPECARWLAEETSITGLGVETVGTDAGAAHGFDPPFPCHAFLLGAGKYGLTQLANLGSLPPTGSLLVVASLPIEGGSGSPCRALALVER